MCTGSLLYSPRHSAKVLLLLRDRPLTVRPASSIFSAAAPAAVAAPRPRPAAAPTAKEEGRHSSRHTCSRSGGGGAQPSVGSGRGGVDSGSRPLSMHAQRGRAASSSAVAQCSGPILSAGLRLQAVCALLHTIGGAVCYFGLKKFYSEKKPFLS